MTSAVDTNVLLDVLVPGAPRAVESERVLLQAAQNGALVICETVYSELSAHFREQPVLDRFLNDTGIRLERSSLAALHAAGGAWREYVKRRSSSAGCPRCGSTQALRCRECGANMSARQHVLADFLIGAHGLNHADRLLTRDRGYYATYFPDLALG